MIYVVTDKKTGAEVSRYAAMAIYDGGFPLSDFEHTELPESPVADERKYGGRRMLTKLEFRALFPETAIKAIDRFQTQFEQSAFLTNEQKDDIRTSFKNYDEALDVNLDDPRWSPGLGLYVALGMMTSEEVSEVLNG